VRVDHITEISCHVSKLHDRSKKLDSNSTKPKLWPTQIRLVAIVLVLAAIVYWVSLHEQGGMKGSYIPWPNLLICITFACIAGYVCKRIWRGFMVPFVAGIAGVFGIVGGLYGPYGGIMGFLTGCLILVLPVGERTTYDANGDV
jgi:hypothetical protein